MAEGDLRHLLFTRPEYGGKMPWILAGILFLLLIVSMFLYSWLFEPSQVEVRFIRMKSPKIRKRFRILFFSDPHLYAEMPGKKIALFRDTIRATMERQSPDIVLIGGDLVDSNSGIDLIGDVFGDIHPPMGVFAVLGNHDYWQYNLLHAFQPAFANFEKEPIDTARLKEALSKNGIRLLSDEMVVLDRGNDRISLTGIDTETFKNGLHRKLHLPGGEGFRLLLTHYPDCAIEYPGEADLALCGHTHGGQITFFGHPIVTRSRVSKRAIREVTIGKEEMVLFVSRGMGVSRYFPLRFFAAPDISVIDLISCDENS
jgi:hypothetical protein